MKNLVKMTLSGLVLATQLVVHSIVQAQGLPDAQNINGVLLMSGGIGGEESNAMLELGQKWPLTLEFSQDHPERPLWVADIKVKVMQGKKIIVETLSDGPILLLNLEPGSYLMEFDYDGRPLRQTIKIENGKHHRVSIRWPKK